MAITSRLWKAGLLALNSTYFPRLVQIAAWHAGKEYTDDLLRKVAADQTLLDAIAITNGDSVDDVLSSLAVTDGPALDAAIVAAVAAYNPSAG
ncbi:hypothetical protein [Cellulosimicrobium cellulans]|uniref:hypothetical protein n=1 Tax=Cellulosimicrobium cellulans TaxID=1710 RepID=UPI001BA7E185|nr:hypothetical protein [Cellulosimicrobium cellulans]QUC01230.1 hypothetical protein J5A69_08735 [Cellulosimicrobium cellulans]